jgi:hypothetical protein
MLKGRQARQQDLPRFALVAREREGTLEDVTRRQHAQLVAQLPRRPPAVEHGDDGVEIDPGNALEAAEETGKAGSAAEAADPESSQTHGRYSMA